MGQTTGSADPASGQGGPNVAASPARQKRVRDYGEELKGLTPSGDEGDGDLNSTPAPKKQKRGHSAGASDSGDLDDGEIVESSSPPGPAELHYQSTSPIDGKPPAGPELRVDGAILEDPRRPGEPRDPGGAPPVATAEHQPVPLSGWNQGVSLESRASFSKGRATPISAKPTVAMESLSFSPVSGTHEKTPNGNSTQQNAPARTARRDKARSPKHVATFEASNLVWHFPAKRARKIDTKAGEAQDRSFWLQRLKPWVLILLQANPAETARLTHKVVRAGFEIYLTRKMGYLQGTKKQVNAARVVAQEAMSSLSKQKLEDMISEAREKLEAGDTRDNPWNLDEEGDSESDRSLSDDDDDDRSLSSEGSVDEESQQQRKYFPGAKDPSEYCLSCSAMGHRAHECPQNTCRFCSSTNHNVFGCPTRQRCTKCRQLGHVLETCQEKLALSSDELGGCAICGAGHLDDDCSEIWRSYNPLEVARKKVKSIPSFCYNCGGQNHYGPECGLPSKGPKVTGPTTWSQANRDLYVDPESEEIAIGWAGIDLNQTENETLPGFRLRGRATRKTHTHFVSSDESEEDLVHAPRRCVILATTSTPWPTSASA
ncbi:hypothetical protein F4775DRAFT_602730 [Biscogniauxia sp. FL1348]|nr:hypothetical protein F4775DRAFT_602730 [Biscogniauxia sp. FL1348]